MDWSNDIGMRGIDWPDTAWDIDRYVEDMTSQEIINFLDDKNRESLYEIERRIVMCALDNDPVGVEFNTKQLMIEIKNVLWKLAQ